MSLWNELKLLLQTKKVVYVNGIRIPSAYTKFDKVGKENISGKKLRIFDLKYPFIFDPENAEYNLFIEKCRADTKELRKALTLELEKRTLPFLGTQKRLSREKRENNYRISFLIMPPFFSSEEDKTDRFQGEGVSFILHFDENHNLHTQRSFFNGPSSIDFFKNRVLNEVSRQKKVLSAAYGDWQLFAKILADIIEMYCEEVSYKKVS